MLPALAGRLASVFARVLFIVGVVFGVGTLAIGLTQPYDCASPVGLTSTACPTSTMLFLNLAMPIVILVASAAGLAVSFRRRKPPPVVTV